MSASKLFADGRELRIDKRIGKGGEGEVFAIANMPGFAVKSYLPGLVTEREKKIRAMVSARLADSAPMVAFPTQVVLNARGAFVGFLMRLVEQHKEIHELQTPSSRQKHFPKADYSFIVRVALNIARVFAQVHATGCVVGDINQRGILVSTKGTVALIDADSFQVTNGGQQYLCVVGVPEYTPPELQGKSLKAVVRTTDHDSFGLAVCVFQLLCMDRHPFSGKFSGYGEMPLERAIAEFRFAYSSRNTGMVPPPGTVQLSDFTPKVAQLFEDAFSPTHVGHRPSASAWVEALVELESSLRICSRNRFHRYARVANECPWCRMESEFGRPLFFDIEVSNIHVPKGRIDPSAGFVLDIPSLMAAINSIPIPTTISISLPQVQNRPNPSHTAQIAQSKKRFGPLIKIGGVGVVIAAIGAFASGIPGIVALGLGGLGAWLLIRSTSPAEGLLSTYRSRANAVASRVQHLQRTAPFEPLLRRKAEALRLIDEFRQLSTNFANARSDYEKHRKEKQLDDHLSQFSLRSARIPKLSSGDLAQLASYGFTTALDTKLRNVQQVHGIGPVKARNIAAWRRRVEANFQFRSSYTPEDQRNIQNAQNAIVVKQQGLEERIRKAIEEFRQEALSFEKWKSSRDQELISLVEQLTQAEVDLQHVGVAAPPGPNVPPTPVPAVSTLAGAPPHSFGTSSMGGGTISQGNVAACPRCGSRMVRRVARRGARAGRPFWGCSRYPSCTGTRPV